jgi:hypothetical protein
MLEVGQNIVLTKKENGHWNDFITAMNVDLAILLAQLQLF